MAQKADFSTSPLAQAILGVLKDKGWLTLREIATGLERRDDKPTSYDRTMLKTLWQQGLVERQEQSHGFRSYWEYRLKQDEGIKTK